METITVIGAGIAGLTAAITCAEAGAPVVLIDAHEAPGGRARTATGPYRANLGPHVLYADGPMFAWLKQQRILPPIRTTPLAGIRLRYDGAVHRTPPLSVLAPVLRLRGREAPVDESFRMWAERHAGERAAALLSCAAGVFTFHHDPGELSAAFVWPRTVRTLFNPPPAARYVVGGWGVLVDALVARACAVGVELRLGERVNSLPERPVIVATDLGDARRLLDDDELNWPSGRTVCLDLGLTSQRGDPFLVSDMDQSGWIERFSAADRTLAPIGEELVQAQMPIRPGEAPDDAGARLEALLDSSFDGWRERTTWRRRQVMDSQSGALDFPGTTWRDRPAVDRGDGVLLAGDRVAAPGLLSEVAWASGREAAHRALALAQGAHALRRVA